MSIQKYGLRYERLLTLAAPLSLACILVAFVAIASDFAKDKKAADCRETAANILEKNLKENNILWGKREMIGKIMFANEYVAKSSAILLSSLPYSCDYDFARQDTNKAIGPSEFVSKLRADAINIRDQSSRRPVRSYGIEIPEKATISLLGTNITVSILTLAQVLQLVLAPVLILWLGSLFNTRYRETILIESETSIATLHPHAINIYINARLPELRKRSMGGYYIKIIFPYIPTAFRLCLLAIFILPPVVFYCTSLYYLGSDEHFVLTLFGGGLVSLFAAVNLIGELNPWHSGKTFPGPRKITFRE